MISQEVKEIAQKIGMFYLEHNKGDYKLAKEAIENIGFTEIKIVQTCIITARKVGLLIGKKCCNIEALEKHLGMVIKPIETNDQITDYIIPSQLYNSSGHIDE